MEAKTGVIIAAKFSGAKDKGVLKSVFLIEITKTT
jgi:hypothetical protein